MDHQIDLRIEEIQQRLSIHAFVRILQTFSKVLLVTELARYEESSTWTIVDLHHSTPTVSIAPQNLNAQAITTMRVTMNRLANLSAGQVPDDPWTGQEIDAYSNFADVLANQPVQISLQLGDTHTTVNSQVRAILESLSPSYAFTEQGSVEGRLESIMVHNNRECGLWDSLSGRKITCQFSPDLIATIGGHINKRVMIEGTLHYTRGVVTQVEVRTIIALPELPQEQSLYGVGEHWFPEDIGSELKELWMRE